MHRASNFRAGRQVLFALQAHLVFVPKYRRAVITERVFSVLRTAWEQVCSDFDCELREIWSPSYCAVSCGGAPLETVSRYIEQQRGGASSAP